jgi:hypothetical protein
MVTNPSSWVLTREHLQAIGIDFLGLFWLALKKKHFATSHVSLIDHEMVI